MRCDTCASARVVVMKIVIFVAVGKKSVKYFHCLKKKKVKGLVHKITER